VRRGIAALAVLAILSLTACDRGDWAGSVERVAREAVNGWDMWETDAVQPHEKPMPPSVPGSIALTGTAGFEQARQQLAALDPAQREERAALVYRRYCHHCHGPNGDARIIVGESFGVPVPDLRSREIQSHGDRELYDSVSDGTEIIIPLAAIMTPLDRLLAIEYVRGLADAPSSPFYEPRNVEPVR
jgi:hypothetical protein